MSIITFDGSLLNANGSPRSVTFILYVSPNSANNGLTLVSGGNVPQRWRIAQGSSLSGQMHGTFDSAHAQEIRSLVQANSAKSGAPLRSITVYRDAVPPAVIGTVSTAVGTFLYWLLYAPDNSSYVTVPMSGDLLKPAWALGTLRWTSSDPNNMGLARAFMTIASQSAAQALAQSNALKPTGTAAASTRSAIAGKPSTSGTSGTSSGVAGIKY